MIVKIGDEIDGCAGNSTADCPLSKRVSGRLPWIDREQMGAPLRNLEPALAHRSHGELRSGLNSQPLE